VSVMFYSRSSNEPELCTKQASGIGWLTFLRVWIQLSRYAHIIQWNGCLMHPATAGTVAQGQPKFFFQQSIFWNRSFPSQIRTRILCVQIFAYVLLYIYLITYSFHLNQTWSPYIKKLTKLVHNRTIYFHNISFLNAHNARLMFYDTCKRTAAILPW